MKQLYFTGRRADMFGHGIEQSAHYTDLPVPPVLIQCTNFFQSKYMKTARPWNKFSYCPYVYIRSENYKI